jgi:hypothetical protein
MAALNLGPSMQVGNNVSSLMTWGEMARALKTVRIGELLFIFSTCILTDDAVGHNCNPKDLVTPLIKAQVMPHLEYIRSKTCFDFATGIRDYTGSEVVLSSCDHVQSDKLFSCFKYQ